MGVGWLCAMETRLRLKRFSLQAGLESESMAARSAGQRLTNCDTGAPVSLEEEPLWKKARYRLKYCLKEPLNQK